MAYSRPLSLPVFFTTNCTFPKPPCKAAHKSPNPSRNSWSGCSGSGGRVRGVADSADGLPHKLGETCTHLSDNFQLLKRIQSDSAIICTTITVPTSHPTKCLAVRGKAPSTPQDGERHRANDTNRNVCFMNLHTTHRGLRQPPTNHIFPWLCVVGNGHRRNRRNVSGNRCCVSPTRLKRIRPESSVQQPCKLSPHRTL